MSTKIAIVGAGPAGLAFGRLLELQGVPFTIFERDPNFADLAGRQGGSLDLHPPSGQLALEACGLMDQFKAVARYDAQEFKVVDLDGRLLMHEQNGGSEEKRPEIDRRQLREILLKSVPADRIRWRSVITTVKKGDDGKMAINMDGGESVAGFDLVVAADGAWSRVRKLVTPETPKFSGFYYLQSEIPVSNERYPQIASMVGPGALMAVGPAKQVAAQRQSDGSYNTYICKRLPEDWHRTNQERHSSPTEFRQKLLDEDFANWADSVKDVIRASEGPLHAWPLYAMPTESFSWKTVPGVALIGDAAHVSTPFVGEGVNCSLHDSLQLAQAIAKHGTDNLTEAVAEYEGQMFPRAVDLITRSTASKDLMLAEDAPKGFKEFLELKFASQN